MTHYDPEGIRIVARQQLSTLYHRNGAAYAITRACLLEQKSTMGLNSGAVIVRDALINVDTMADLAAADQLLRRRSADPL